jgi:hypothetical protein
LQHYSMRQSRQLSCFPPEGQVTTANWNIAWEVREGSWSWSTAQRESKDKNILITFQIESRSVKQSTQSVSTM